VLPAKGGSAAHLSAIGARWDKPMMAAGYHMQHTNAALMIAAGDMEIGGALTFDSASNNQLLSLMQRGKAMSHFYETRGSAAAIAALVSGLMTMAIYVCVLAFVLA